VERLAEVEQRVRHFFGNRARDVAAVYLFGSVARGTTTSSSDVDVGVLLSQDPAPTLEGLLLDLEADLERELGVPVQVVVLNTAPCDLAHRVLRDGRLVVDRDSSRRIRFEVRVRNEFFDLEPILRRYRKQDTAPPASRR
jgi:predicted nucleotidyltransferase